MDYPTPGTRRPPIKIARVVRQRRRGHGLRVWPGLRVHWRLPSSGWRLYSRL